MIAGWRRRGVASARRSKRHILVAVGVLVVLGVVIGEVAADVVDAGRRAASVTAQTFVAGVIPVIDESTTLAATMHLVRAEATSNDRIALERALGSLVAGTSDNVGQLQTLGIPAPNARSEQLLHDTLAARSDGARMLTGGIALATGPTANQARVKAAALIVAAGEKLMAGDEDYRLFVRSLPRDSGRSRLPASIWVGDPPSWSPAPVSIWVAQLASTPELQIRQHLTIVAVSLQPPVVRISGLPTTTTTSTTSTTSTPTTTSTSTTTTFPGTSTSATTTSTSTSTTTSTSTSTTTTTLQLPPSGSTSVLPPTRAVSVVMVIANAGNVPISGIWASGSVVGEPSAGRHPKPSPPTHTSSVRIGRLAPGASVDVTLPPLAVDAGDAYTLWASVGTGTLPRQPVTSDPKGLGQTDKVTIKVAAE